MSFIAVGFTVFIGFIFSLFVDVGFAYRVDWFIFGLSFRVDFMGKSFLIFSSFIWLISALYSYKTITTNKNRYWFWFLFTFIGNYGLILSYDTISFYLFFSLMSLAAFGLVIHTQTPQANGAAFIYIKYAIIGEIALFIAIILTVNHYGGFSFNHYKTAIDPIAFWLLLLGFGIKSGVLSLHFWLPLAHGNAPAAASAVLSGVMLKAGILGLIRYLPFGQSIEIVGGITLCILGVAGIYGGVYGIFKEKIKVVLAYSSISQMGYLLTLLGVALLNPNLWGSIIVAIVFFSIHHAINKSALFLLSGEVLKNGLNPHFILLGLIFSLSLIGVGYTSGDVAKQIMINSISNSSILIPLLSFSVVVTTLLMAKVYYLSYKTPKKNSLNFHPLYILYPMAIVSLLLFLVV